MDVPKSSAIVRSHTNRSPCCFASFWNAVNGNTEVWWTKFLWNSGLEGPKRRKHLEFEAVDLSPRLRYDDQS